MIASLNPTVRSSKLHIVKPGIDSILRHQFIMAPGFHNFTLLQNLDYIGGPNGGEAMSNHKCCTVLHQIVQRFLDKNFGFRIQR